MILYRLWGWIGNRNPLREDGSSETALRAKAVVVGGPMGMSPFCFVAGAPAVISEGELLDAPPMFLLVRSKS